MLTDQPATSPKPAMSRKRLAQWALNLSLLAIILDQTVKGIAIITLPYGKTEPTIIPWLDLRLVLNPGAAFGLGARFGPLLAAGIFIILVVLTAWTIRRIVHRDSPLITIALAVAAAGGWGNMIDRILRAERGLLSGAVVDYLSISWFAIFNLADVFAVGGIAAAALLWTLDNRRQQQAKLHDHGATQS
ncbi:signal peptidase II [Leifsonia sp. NCR5]|uniref:signal peptidase II n=1 Tax=Leifsonia sp. NCR5 TaxID=1978342 RepID=UPI000A192BC5|nr:signal peptidase II [Leifsonia sp. NCR5]